MLQSIDVSRRPTDWMMSFDMNALPADDNFFHIALLLKVLAMIIKDYVLSKGEVGDEFISIVDYEQAIFSRF